MGDAIGPLYQPTGVPGHLRCARTACPSPHTAQGHNRYCSRQCMAISKAVNGSPLRPCPSWTWAH